MNVGLSETVLVVLRGPSGSGKSTVVAALRKEYGRGLAVIGQDVVRRTIVWEKDHPGAANVSLIDAMARDLLNQGVHVVIEGILYAANYGDMLTSLMAAHQGSSYSYYWDLPFDTTVERHWTKPNCRDWTVAQMRSWYREHDYLPGGPDRIIGPATTAEAAVERILAETGLSAAPRPPHSSFRTDNHPNPEVRTDTVQGATA